MAKFTDYTQKTKPADADLLLIHDNAGAANKKTPFSGVWSWILDKLASAVISQLETTNKSIIPAINELNSKMPKNVTSIQGLISKTGEAHSYTIPISANSSLISEITSGKFSVSGKGFAINDTVNVDFMFMLGSGDALICGRITAATGEVSGIVNEYRAVNTGQV